MVIQSRTAKIKLLDDNWTSLGASYVTADPVQASGGLVEDSDFEIDRQRGRIRRLRPMGEDEQGLFDFTFEFNDRSELMQAKNVEDAAIKQQLFAIAGSAVGVALPDLNTTQLKAMIGLLLRNVGGLDDQVRVKPLAEWVH